MEEETAASVRPQKLPAANTTRALSAGTPFTSYALVRRGGGVGGVGMGR